MRSSLVAIPLLLVLTLTAACGDDDKSSGDGAPSESSSATVTPTGESGSPSATATEPVTAEQFCDDATAALKGSSADEVLQQVAQVVADGLPEDMPQDAIDGIQVLIDIAPELEHASTALKAYQGLSSAQRSHVNALAAYLTTTCGKNLVADLVPALKDIPEELRSLLPKELTKH